MKIFSEEESKEHTDIAVKDFQRYAIELRGKGYNCAQCVLMSLADHLDIDEDMAAMVTASLGGGFAASGEICGAMSALGIAEGLAERDSSSLSKLKAMKVTATLLNQFKEENNGRFLCRDLKGKVDARSCPDLIRQAIEIFLPNQS